jgi:Rrf2 family protein
MNLSNTAQYAIRILSYMAYEGKQLYPASEIYAKLKISDKYLKRILTTLSSHKIIISIQGRYGGFKMAKDVKEISIYDIVKAVDQVEKYFGCVLGFEECSDENPCSLHYKWAPLRDELLQFLETTSLKDVMDNPKLLKF